MASSPSLILVWVLESLLVLGGLGLLWRLYLSSEGRQNSPSPKLRPWTTASVPQILLLVWLVLVGGVLFQTACILLIPGLDAAPDLKRIAAGIGFQFGMLGGCFAFMRYAPSGADFDRPKTPLLRAGLGTFLMLLPIVFGVGLVWHALMEQLGIPPEKQELVALFQNQSSPTALAVMFFMAIVVAPVTEELVFRAGLYRFLRTRIPHWAALLIPALLFAALHSSLSSLPQLVALAVVFSLAYERTGNIGVPIFAHCLFNLNTLLLLLSGVDA